MKKIQLSQGLFALVDNEDFEYLNQWKWSAQKSGLTYYAVRIVKKEKISMHRLLLGLADPKVLADHEDNNGLNNQRYNIRAANYTQNNSNVTPVTGSTSKYLGVSWHSSSKKWKADIRKGKVKKYLGIFKDEADAARAYNAAAKELHGVFANLNYV